MLEFRRSYSPGRGYRPGGACYDGQAQPQALAAVALWILKLVIVLEDLAVLVLGDAKAGVPYLDAQHRSAASATEQYLSLIGMAYGIGE